MSSSRLAAWLVILVIGVIGLIMLKDLLIPLVLAVTVWYIINTLASTIRRIKIGKKEMPYTIALVFSAIVITGALVVAIEIIVQSVESMVLAAPTYQANLQNTVNSIMEYFNMDHMPSVTQVLEEVDLSPLVSELGTNLSAFAGSLFMVIFYLVFLLIEQHIFPQKLRLLFPSQGKYDKMRRTLNRINSSIRTYIGIKALTSLATGIASFIVMKAVGLDFAIFWAFLIFLLNFIPTIGSMVATAFPSIFALIQFDGITHFLIIFFAIGGLQVLIGSLIEPRLMGNSLNISALVVLISLTAWGAVWGVTGMVLSAPITVAGIIIMSEFPKTRPIAVLLSANGNVGDEKEESPVVDHPTEQPL